ncbi:nucleotide-binding protein [Polyangium jinanense]|uniref:CobQ/CobB/MinD/ParA nucleotide binding domain-containing protein n=1 Tax=Polyangium jinanense TaxID=2829994 RepID=A0A9X4AYN9_9BACT|nr:hypothetical protein [Polyangium jinanense]MDC3961035.1 hypothetical protein [Polyangium jinanense]MDC3987455.1 hypothetical protein [Polyangium jinanense]
MSDRQGIIVGLASARGGVGRAMAVANVGALLAQKGKRVLVVDLAVDEPALERYFQGRGEGRKGAGVVHFFEGVRAAALPLVSGRGRDVPPEAAVRAGITQFLDGGAGIRVVPLKLGGAPAEMFYWPAEGARSAVTRARVIEECSWLLAPLAQALRARYDEVLVNMPSGRTEATALLAAHLVDKLVLLVDDASLEEAIDLGRFAHARRALVDASRPLPLFPLLVRVEEGASGRAFVQEAKEQLEGLIYETTNVMGRDLGPYLGLATIPWNERAARGAAIAAEIESAADPKSLAHAYLRFVQCLRRQSPLDVGEAARPSSRDLWAAIEARRGRSGPDSSPPPSSRLVVEDRGSSPPSGNLPQSVRLIEGDPFARAAVLRAEGNFRAARKAYLEIARGEIRDEGGSRDAARALLALGDLSIESGDTSVSDYGEVIRRFFPRRFEDPEFLTAVLLASYRQGKFHAGREAWAEACKHLGMALELAEEMRLTGEPPWLRAVHADAAHAAGVCCQELGWDDTAANHFSMACAAGVGVTGSGYRAVEAASLAGSVFSFGRMGALDRALDAARELARKAAAPAAETLSAWFALGAANAAATLALAGHPVKAATALAGLRERLAGATETPYFEIAAAVACNEVTALDAAGRHEEADARIAEVRARFAGSLHLPILEALCAAECSHAITRAARGQAREASETLSVLRDRLMRAWLRLEAGPSLLALVAGVSYSLAHVLEREGRVDEARAALAEASLRARWDDPRRPRILGRAGLALLRVASMLQGFGVPASEASFEVARKHLREAAEHGGSDPFLLGCAGILALFRADEEEARGFLEKSFTRGGEAALARAWGAVRAAMKPHEGWFVREIGARISSLSGETRDALGARDPSGLGWILALAGAPVAARKEGAAPSATPPEVASGGGLGRANTRAIRTHAAAVCRPDTLLSTEPPVPWLSCPLLLLEQQDEGASTSASGASGRARGEVPEVALPEITLPVPRTGPEGNLLGMLAALYTGTSAYRAALRRTTVHAGGVEEVAELVDAWRGEDGEPLVRIFPDDPAEEVLLAHGSETSLVRRGHVIAKSTLEDSPYVALAAVLSEGLGAAFDVVISGEEGRAWMAVISAVPRKPRAGCARARIEVDRVLVARGDLGAIRRVVIWDARGDEHRFTMEGTTRLLPSAAAFAQRDASAPATKR